MVVEFPDGLTTESTHFVSSDLRLCPFADFVFAFLDTYLLLKWSLCRRTIVAGVLKLCFRTVNLNQINLTVTLSARSATSTMRVVFCQPTCKNVIPTAANKNFGVDGELFNAIIAL